MNVTLKLLMVLKFQKAVSLHISESKAGPSRFFLMHDIDKKDETRQVPMSERSPSGATVIMTGLLAIL